jgi:hypothetical protein
MNKIATIDFTSLINNIKFLGRCPKNCKQPIILPNKEDLIKIIMNEI